MSCIHFSSSLPRLIIVDPRVDEYRTFLGNSDSVDLYFCLSAERDGVDQITRLLSEYDAVESLHIVSHGSPGALHLGSTQLDLEILNEYQAQLKGWAETLSDNAQILLYGCQVAAGNRGRAFVQAFRQLTGANVAASSTPVGNRDRGGNWNLDFQTGQFVPNLAFDAVTLEGYRSVLMDSGQMAHPDDPGKAAEHQGLLDLIPVESGGSDVTTHRATSSGNWFNPNTWEGGQVPNAGAIVHIPDNISVTYEGSSNAPLFAVRVDGDLTFTAENGTDTKMVVDTLITTADSQFVIDADAASDGTVDVEIRPFDIEAHEAAGASGWNRAAIDHYSDGAIVMDTGAGTRSGSAVSDGAGVLGRYNWDPLQLSLGVVTHGSVRINGQEKLSKSSVASTAMAGDTSIQLDESPSGWQVGDRIVITGTHYVGREAGTGESLGSQDEVRTITQVNGNTVTFDRPLDFNHDTPRADLNAYVANLTRNIEFHSATDLSIEGVLEADDVSDVASTLGHTMFMHNEDVQVRYAAFDDLGRSNKNDVLDDFERQGFDGLDADRKTDRNGEWVRTPANEVTNPRGRYAVHLHRTGATTTDDTALIEGSVVTGGPGWGFVHHDSRANLFDNVTYGVLGSGFISETGNETGTWARNIAINTYGADFNDNTLDPKGRYSFVNNSTDSTMTLEKRGSWKNQDMGHFGNGFWYQGKLLDSVDNVSVNSGLDGYFFMFRAPDQINVDPNVLEEPLSVHSPNGIHPFAPGLNVFTGNESIADTRGLDMIGIGGGRTNDERSIIDDFTAWEVGEVGTGAQYYPGYTIKNSIFIGSNSPNANASMGVFFKTVQLDVVLANLEIEGFDQKYELRKSWSGGTVKMQGFDHPYDVIQEALDNGHPNPLPNGFAHVLINPGFTEDEASSQTHLMGGLLGERETVIRKGKEVKVDGYEGGTFDPNYDLILTSDDLQIGRFNIEFDDSSLAIDLDNRDIEFGTEPDDPIRPTLQEGHVLLLKGTKTDSIGTIPIDNHNNVLVWHEDAIQHRLETEGYYHMPNGFMGVILEELFSDRYTADKYIWKFTAELDPRWDLTGAIDRGDFDVASHPDVYVPQFLLDSPDESIRIDVGGDGLTDMNGNVWVADYGFQGGRTSYNDRLPIANTDNDEIHYGKRYGDNFSYNFELANGTYDVVLHTMDPISDAEVGSRVFDVEVEGVLRVDDFDIFEELGASAASRTAVTKTVSDVSVTDGVLNLDFTTVAGRPVTLSGIEILSADSIGVTPALEIGLFDAESDVLIAPLEEGATISVSAFDVQNLAIVATVPESSSYFGEVESIALDLNNGQVTKTENVEPYALFGDSSGGSDFAGGAIPLGNNTIELELYAQNNLNGQLLDTISVDFTLV
ncbi:MAG: DUF4347 domain-containing protein [Cyanobacteria bacterium P01_F01_bin.33]